MKKVKCELKKAKEAVNEAWVEYFESMRKFSDVIFNIDLTNYIPDEIPEEVIEDILKKSPSITQKKLAYEIAGFYWRIRCEADAKYVAAKKAVDEANEVIRAKEEVLKRLQTV